MGQWEPLPDRIPVDMRRLATQLRRMKDRSGMTVPALAARTAHSVEGWERAFAARQLPPLDAVEVLAQASGADYDRTGALWKLAEKAADGTGDRGRGRPVPRPDPLDPLGAEEGLPGRRRRFALLGAVAALAVAALVGVILTAGASDGRAPGGGSARPTVTGPSVPERFGTTGAPSHGHPSGRASGGGPAATSAAGHGDRPSPAMDATSPEVTPSGPTTPAGPGTSSSSSATAGSGGSATGGQGGQGGTTAPPQSSPPPTGATPSPTPTAGPTHSPLCLGLIVLGICVG